MSPPGLSLIGLQPTSKKNANAAYLHATFHWHIDGCTPETDEAPQMASGYKSLREKSPVR